MALQVCEVCVCGVFSFSLGFLLPFFALSSHSFPVFLGMWLSTVSHEILLLLLRTRICFPILFFLFVCAPVALALLASKFALVQFYAYSLVFINGNCHQQKKEKKKKKLPCLAQ